MSISIKDFTREVKDFSTITTTTLPARATEVIMAGIVEALKEVAGLRALGFVDRVQKGDDVYVYFTADSMGDARTDAEDGDDFIYDSAGASQSTADFTRVRKGFEITWESDSLKRLPLRAAQAKQAAMKVREAEDGLIVTELANVTSSVTGSGVLSGSSADPVKDIRSAKTAIRKLGYVGGDIIMEPTNLEELMSIVASNTWYGVTEQALKSGGLPSFMGLKITEEPNSLSHGTAYVVKRGNGGAFNLGEAVPMTTNIFDDKDRQTTKVQVFEKVCPKAVRPDAGAAITGW